MTATTTAKTARPSRRAAKVATLLAVPAAVAVSGLVVSQASYSAYSATTVNPTSNWATGTVVLADDDANTAAFTVANLKPGSTGTQCVVVTSKGSLASAVRLYATTPTSTKDVAANLDLKVTQGTGGSFGSCTGYTPLASGADVYTGTLDNLGKTATGYTSGLGSWTPTGKATESRTYQITYTVRADAPDSTQGGTAAAGLTWEAQNS
ncbi:hypothetical protein SAMN04488543_2032 [Friedmanniella luteola]|uniref:Camelysin metallo-endopeptidase n=1 Tax=Friedmanniella luteola TaxID=546871 RepID=A0A1H1TI60_9ACTN|nr:hypothetical protein [Friedmanniella luteola]SDS59957.1 hypothetical protein SAMN04488543_2032 [Friedmanniella luteola]